LEPIEESDNDASFSESPWTLYGERRQLGHAAFESATFSAGGSQDACHKPELRWVMAVDYFHPLFVRGPRPQLADLRRRLARTWSRRLGRRTWTEELPFSFAALYDTAPAASRVERDVPGEPYDVRVWPIAQGERGRRNCATSYIHARSTCSDFFGRCRARADR
jgi:hypothetical protein